MMNRCQTARYVFVLCLLFLLLGEKAFAIPALRTLAENRGIEIRTAVVRDALKYDPDYPIAFATQFNAATPELSLIFKWVHPAPDTYDFTYADQLVDFAESAGTEVHGHSLVYHHMQSRPDWLVGWRYTRDELIAILEDHIKTVVGRYKGRIKSWDVVNEAIAINGSFRKFTFWLHTIGPEVIDMAFQWAHEADPDALLFYKDFSIGGPKADGIYKMVAGMLQRGVPIHGVNMQAHMWLDLIDSENFLDAVAKEMKRLSDLGLQVNIAELDVPIREPVTEEKLQAQASIYAEALRLCLCSPSCKVFEMWGLTDRYSWMNGNDVWGAPLILDDNYIPKPAFDALANVLQEFFDADADGIRDDNGSCTRITNPCIDGDTVGCYDNCPDIENPGQEDQDGDAIGDACDICPTDPANDSDGDGFCANVDNCPDIANPGQEDGSCAGGIWQAGVPDGIGNACQDSDGDLLTDMYELDNSTDPCGPATAIVPDIKANDIDDTAVITQGDNLTVTISLDPGGYLGVLADFWIYAYSYNQATELWETISTNSDTAPIVALPPLTILDTNSFPNGTFMFSFGIDFNPDGSVDTDQIVGDSVKVIVE